MTFFFSFHWIPNFLDFSFLLILLSSTKTWKKYSEGSEVQSFRLTVRSFYDIHYWRKYGENEKTEIIWEAFLINFQILYEQSLCSKKVSCFMFLELRDTVNILQLGCWKPRSEEKFTASKTNLSGILEFRIIEEESSSSSFFKLKITFSSQTEQIDNQTEKISFSMFASREPPLCSNCFPHKKLSLFIFLFFPLMLRRVSFLISIYLLYSNLNVEDSIECKWKRMNTRLPREKSHQNRTKGKLDCKARVFNLE